MSVNPGLAPAMPITFALYVRHHVLGGSGLVSRLVR